LLLAGGRLLSAAPFLVLQLLLPQSILLLFVQSDLLSTCGLLLLMKGLLLANPDISQVLSPHHGPVILELSVSRPVLVLADPVGVVGGNPVGVLVVPPLAVMPVVL
jgi:hypothetical protein